MKICSQQDDIGKTFGVSAVAVKCGGRISKLMKTKENYTNEWKNNIIIDLNK